MYLPIWSTSRMVVGFVHLYEAKRNGMIENEAERVHNRKRIPATRNKPN